MWAMMEKFRMKRCWVINTSGARPAAVSPWSLALAACRALGNRLDPGAALRSVRRRLGVAIGASRGGGRLGARLPCEGKLTRKEVPVLAQAEIDPRSNLDRD